MPLAQITCVPVNAMLRIGRADHKGITGSACGPCGDDRTAQRRSGRLARGGIGASSQARVIDGSLKGIRTMINVLRAGLRAAFLACSAITALLCTTLCATPALADPAAPPASTSGPAAPAPASKNELEEVVVTAEKRESTVQATAISMTALTSEDLKTENIASVDDLVTKVPGISIRTAGPGQTEYEMRGLSAAGGSAATVGFYMDETPLSANAVALNGRTVIDADLFDLNRRRGAARPAGHLVWRGIDGRHHQAGHQPAEARRVRGGDRFGGVRHPARQPQRQRQPDAEPAAGRDLGPAHRRDREVHQRLDRPQRDPAAQFPLAHGAQLHVLGAGQLRGLLLLARQRPQCAGDADHPRVRTSSASPRRARAT